ncbi:DUF4148 domain-containing protein [Burkholderia sp. Ac-20379]|uniref:DUF4148 domain-containing protein n=1 Tax=Burkholderia sp. Ac-20379 TaxID=2703900 RepID=UPI001980D55E|nr:DUF4148 domain-containing protein [Burkholderia sp. Ac-20379]MBN3727982.1 DUF4148 domain-containing protein [Burkholderia sp. Ac-20379]
MRFSVRAARAAVMLLAVSAGLYSQASHAEATRAQVRADLARVEQAGFDPIGETLDFPNDIQAAEARLAASDAAAAPLAVASRAEVDPASAAIPSAAAPQSH